MTGKNDLLTISMLIGQLKQASNNAAALFFCRLMKGEIITHDEEEEEEELEGKKFLIHLIGNQGTLKDSSSRPAL